MFVYFDGNHSNLRKTLREGIASVFLNAMLFGSNLQEIVQNAVLLNLPEWFKAGLVSFVGEEWNSELDNQLRDLMTLPEYQTFQKLAEDHPKLAGHAMWYFISQTYGRSTVSNLLYLTRINRSIESGFLYVLGSPYERTAQAWSDYFKQRYETESKTMSPPIGKHIVIKNKRNLPVSQVKLSPDGKRLAYVLNEIGKYRVYVQDIATGERKTVHKGGHRNPFQATDYEYPLLAWNPNNRSLAILYEKRDVARLLIHDLTNNESITEPLAPEYQRVYNMEFISPFNLVFSANVRGFSDIFIYQTKTRQSQRITNDFYDDLDATFTTAFGKKGILFASNRPDSSMTKKVRIDTILPIETFDIFYYNLEDRPSELVQVTHTPYANERCPMGLDTTWLTYLSDASGLFNRRSAYLDSVFVYNEQVITLTDGDEITLHEDSTLTELDESMIDTIVLRPVFKVKAFSHASSNFNRSIISQHTAQRSGRAIDVFYKGGRYEAYTYPSNPTQQVTVSDTRYFNNREQKETLPEEKAPQPTPEEEAPRQELPKKEKSQKESWLFQSEFDEPEEGEKEESTLSENTNETPEGPVKDEEEVTSFQQPIYGGSQKKANQSKVTKFRPSRIVPYRIKFKTDYVTTQLDNSPLFGGMDGVFSDSLSQGNTQAAAFNYQPPGILLKANFKDLFEDYEVEGGVRIPTTFNGTEYFLTVHDKKKRLDKRYSFYRRSLKFSDGAAQFGQTPKRREQVIIGQAEYRYPLDIFSSIRLQGNLRLDKRIQLATDANTLNRPTIKNQRFGLRGEYVFDNTMNVDLNIRYGTRYKFYAEISKGVQVDLIDNFTFDFSKGFLTVVGLDARHYQRLDKHSIFAARVAGATSFGSQKMLFYLGGVDNWLFPSRNNETLVPDPEGFAYKLLASNMRGFRANIRNGSSFALLNTELRVPIFKYLAKRVRSSFFRNFQIVGFFDAGTAWHGLTPYSKDNPLNTRIESTSNGETELITLKINYFKDPVIFGYGAGLRTVLFGYFIRLDYAWGIETRQVQDPVFYLSLGTDF